jgi:hypothetical protein
VCALMESMSTCDTQTHKRVERIKSDVFMCV